MSSTPQPASGPVRSMERIHVLDILRGFALFGMIVVHFHQDVNTQVTGLEDLIGWAVWIGIESKSWGTFAFLFGVGFAVLLRRMEVKGLPFVSLYLRRLLVLGLFGVAAEALFGYHVLLGYAIWGVPLLLIHRLPTRALLALAAVAVVAGPVISGGAALGVWPPLTSTSAAEAGARLYGAAETARQSGSYLELVSARLDWMAFKYLRVVTLVPEVTLALFILGLLALRTGLVEAPRAHARAIVGWMSFGFFSWSLTWLVFYRLPQPESVAVGAAARVLFAFFRDQWLCLTFVGAVTLLVAYGPAWAQRLSWLGWSGRMALTNYMLQVAALDFIVADYGLSLRLRPALGMVGAGALFAAEVVFSRWWLARYRFGPCEWLWRSLTYGRLQPMRRIREVEAADVALAGASTP